MSLLASAAISSGLLLAPPILAGVEGLTVGNRTAVSRRFARVRFQCAALVRRAAGRLVSSTRLWCPSMLLSAGVVNKAPPSRAVLRPRRASRTPVCASAAQVEVRRQVSEEEKARLGVASWGASPFGAPCSRSPAHEACGRKLVLPREHFPLDVRGDGDESAAGGRGDGHAGRRPGRDAASGGRGCVPGRDELHVERDKVAAQALSLRLRRGVRSMQPLFSNHDACL